MKARTYNISLRTPLGDRKGTLRAEREGNRLNGWLDVMKHREPFEGNVDGEGNCKISGEFVTLMRRVPYVATGHISDSMIRLEVKGSRNIFELSGAVCPESEDVCHAENL